MSRWYRFAGCVLVASFVLIGWSESALGGPLDPIKGINIGLIKKPVPVGQEIPVVPTDQIPSPGAPYIDFSDGGQVEWPSLGIVERGFQFTPSDGMSPTLMPDGSWAVDSFFDIFYEIELEMSGVITPFSGNGIAHMVGTAPAGGGDVRTFDTEMLSLNISNPSFMLRESPTRASLGQTLLTSTPPFPPYRIDSFFDVFVELSLDGGQSWVQSVSQVPEPSAIVLTALAACTLIGARRRR